MSKKDDKSSLVNVGYAEAASSLRREFEAMVLHRRKADNAVDSMENQARDGHGNQNIVEFQSMEVFSAIWCRCC